MKRELKTTMHCLFSAALFLFFLAGNSQAGIDGITGTTFALTVKTGRVNTPDGASLLLWGYANGNDPAQYPGPTLIVNQGETITITLSNELTVTGTGPAPNVSMVFPGHQATSSLSNPGVPGILANEARPGDSVTYTFTATHPGTYLYYSGTDPALQVEMGLLGAIIVRPSDGNNYAYNHPDTQFDREYLFLLSEMDPRIHEVVELDGAEGLAATDYLSNPFPVVWFINGRNAPDTLDQPGTGSLPNQPYNSAPLVHPGERLLMRVIGGGKDLHPFHHHGNHARIIARDGRLLESIPGAGPDLSHEVYTIQSVPGETVDAIFQWTGKGLNWDIYGTPEAGPQFVHDCTDGDADDYDDTTYEYCPDHGKKFPVVLPDNLDLAFGGFYSGSPYFGNLGSLPPGEGGLNPFGGYAFMWHSHTEKELTNFDIFPGGLMTMLVIVPQGAPIP
ncbi:MAG: multicopper oxidase domain-containing protein [Proteobacteria bacterium]|nr:multicopper oxidase domain-containing protein [Pseudomonadota bacterium]MBU1139757.1 multicopper oxidase domain-containing protein [Pseudomonadota bacterium]